jgi:methionine synthase II (cobalamin-independent)
MTIPTENVGSLPRSSKLQSAITNYDDGKITREELER